MLGGQRALLVKNCKEHISQFTPDLSLERTSVQPFASSSLVIFSGVAIMSAGMSSMQQNKPNLFIFLLFIFLFIFPKGGVKFQEIPLTWGYLLLPLLSLFKWPEFSLNERSRTCLLALIPLQLIFCYSFLVNGVENNGFFFAFLYSFFLLPSCFFSFDFPILQPKWITRGLLFLAIFGILLFFYKLVAGDFFEIPYLTVNGSDAGQIGEKCIERGDYFKLISTYQNGNLFGICMLMLLPLFATHEKSIWKTAIVKLALLLTLSRTVWMGLLLFELLTGKKWKILLICGGLLFLAIWMDFSWDFFFDTSLGGRSEGFDILQEMTLFPSKPFGDMQEIVYLGMIENLGVFGLFAYLLATLTPVLLLPKSPERTGIILFFLLSFSDGALLFIPTMALFWALCNPFKTNNINKSLLHLNIML